MASADMLVAEAQRFLFERGLDLTRPTIYARLRDGTLKPGKALGLKSVTRASAEKLAADPEAYRRKFRPGRKTRKRTAAPTA